MLHQLPYLPHPQQLQVVQPDLYLFGALLQLFVELGGHPHQELLDQIEHDPLPGDEGSLLVELGSVVGVSVPERGHFDGGGCVGRVVGGGKM